MVRGFRNANRELRIEGARITFNDDGS
jgi:hypothetical protein